MNVEATSAIDPINTKKAPILLEPYNASGNPPVNMHTIANILKALAFRRLSFMTVSFF
jgi:hypothetical protein